MYLEWDPANYSGVGRIFPDTDKVWLPRLTVLNSLNELKPVGTSYSFIIVTSNGLTTWYPAEVFETFCEINVKYFPFDIQTCFFTFFNWGEDITEVDFQVTENSVNLTTYHDNGEWELLSTGVYRQTHTFDDKLYPLIVVEMTLKRRPIILIMTVIFPISVLSFLNVFVFLIPLESGERLSFSMSAFLSYAIFFDFILGSLPSSGDEVSLSLIIISAQLFLSSVYVLVGILTSALVHRDDATKPCARHHEDCGHVAGGPSVSEADFSTVCGPREEECRRRV
ncbi:hypothetical protein C0Q70_10277 [Pomacea canaliculata]|uniref:Uncharacterized protein n=2 Tax=Pomacea canaliculata TaxID=400727 RepID=A0A2T7PC62_POMCA|nr:hypothetical protein C0Q70_10277 [Pomacea canaliculata]